MGKGDIKTKRGKISNGTFGVSRPHSVKSSAAATGTPKLKVREVKPNSKK